MDGEAAWPPPSARAALLTSPSGRRKLEERRRLNGYGTSPVKNTHSLTDRFHLARDHSSNSEDEEEDEETLELKLAVIEAKLKLKKLQQSKNKAAQTGREHNGLESREFSAVEVLLSPTKKAVPQVEPRSPGRVLLGIDKGIRAADVSLRRARTVHGSPLKGAGRAGTSTDRPASRLTAYGSARSAASTASNTSHVKSFSERMAEIRDKERLYESKHDHLVKNRNTDLKLNEAELKNYRLAAEEASKHNPPGSPTRQQTEYSREEVLATQRSTTTRLAKSKSTPNLRRSPSRSRTPALDQSNKPVVSRSHGDSSLYEPFSCVYLTTRILPHSFLKRTIPEDTFTTLRIPDLLRQVTQPAYELPDSIISYAVCGIIASKSSPLDHKQTPGDKSKGTNDWEKKWEDGSQNQKRFMVFQITDLKWSINLYLFGTAVPRYHRLTPGTVVAVVNPSIMPPKKGKEDTGAFSLTLNSGDDTVLEIGTARDLGFCNAVKRDGKECSDWVDSSKTEVCEFHLSTQIARTQSSRMGVNTGSNNIGGGGGKGARNKNNIFNGGRASGNGLKPRQEGRQYDSFTGSHYFIASSAGGGPMGTAPIYNPERNAANLIDMDDDDPFIAAGQLSRDDKAGRLRKRLATQEKEREIGRILGSGGTGGAGGEYFRHRAGLANEAGTQGKTAIQRTALAAKADILHSGVRADVTRKRMAENVRLSPVKKTRFVTDRGIKEAGRESLGVVNGQDEDDDDLDIV